MRSPLVVVWAVLALALPVVAHAATFVVDSTVDAHDAAASSGNTECRTLANECTLRAAVEQAGVETTPTTIIVPEGLYVLTLGGRLLIQHDTTILGTPPTSVGGGSIVDANLAGDIFYVSDTPTVVLRDLILRRGRAMGACADIGGSALCNAGTTLVERCTFTENEGSLGGAIFNGDSGTLTVVDSTISNGPGAAIGNGQGTVTLRGSTITGHASGVVTFGGTFFLIDSTISGNSGRALNAYCLFTTCSVTTLANATVTDGIDVQTGFAGTPTVTLRNSIVAGTCSGSFVSEGYNVVAPSASGCIIGGDATGNQIGVDPLLVPLADNGGPTATRAIDATSPAHDAGNPGVPGSGGTTCEVSDQRGLDRAGEPRCDVGAFEDVCVSSGVCGNGVLEGCEQCDDGNAIDGDCCSSVCRPTNPGAVCNDGDPCTSGEQCVSGGCVNGAPCDPDCLVCNPGVGCEMPSGPICAAAAPAQSSLALRDRPGKPTADRLVWKWKNAAPVVLGDFGTPSATRYRFCLYDGADHLILSAATDGTTCAPATSCWTPKSHGWGYKDRSTASDGLATLTLLAGDAGKGRIAVLGKGAGLGGPVLGVPTPVRARLSRADSGQCWEASFGAGLKKNTSEQLSGRNQ